ncbi:MAG: RidA family protein [Chloroflexi bacterium]|nr:RidA family protein [Chloroflexota bacterium]
MAGFKAINAPELYDPSPELYCHAIRAGNLLFCAGHIGRDKAENYVGPGDVEAQAKQALENLGHTLRAAGGSFRNVVRLTIYLRNQSDRGKVAEVRSRFFGDHLPTTTTLTVNGIGGNPGTLVAFEATAVLDG